MLPAEFFATHKYWIKENYLTPTQVNEEFCPELIIIKPHLHRVHVGSFKQSGSVSSQILSKYGPKLYDLYYNDQLKSYVESVVGEKLYHCPVSDPHGVALYSYTEIGDHIGPHYDKSFYRGRRYTVLLGLIQDSTTCQLVLYRGASKLNQRNNPLVVATNPGDLIIFDETMWHEVTPLSNVKEERMVLSMEFVTDSEMSCLWKCISRIKDRILYFG